MSNDRRIPAADSPEAEAGAKAALSLMVEALKLLDRNDGPHDVCANLDLAINRLRVSIDEGNDAAG